MRDHRCKCFMCCSTTERSVPQREMQDPGALAFEAVHRPDVYGPVGESLRVTSRVRTHGPARIGSARALQRANMGAVSRGWAA